MRKRKMMATLAAMVFATSLIISCSKDNDENKENGGDSNGAYPKTLIYNGYEVKDFKLYVGSPEGGKEIDTKNINFENFWGDDFQRFYKKYSQQKYNFLNDSLITFVYSATTHYENRPYRFEGNELQMYYDSSEGWRALGNGDRTKISQNRYFSKGVKNGTEGAYQFDNMEDALTTTEFNSLENMKDVKDTIAWAKFECSWK